MIVYSKRRLRIAELHFDEQGPVPKVDIVRYQSRPEKERGSVSYPQATILIDLQKTPDELLGEMSKTTRNEIRRAAKDELTFEFTAKADDKAISQFFTFYDEFARMKGLDGLNRERLTGMRDCESLVLSRVKSADGTVLVWHCYVSARRRARLNHSASLFRAVDKAQQAVTSRANRYLHWMDMLELRDRGFTVYDFGGWYDGQEDVEKLNINKFKEGFGGQVTQQYNTDRGVTLKGLLAVHLRHAASAFRGKR